MRRLAFALVFAACGGTSIPESAVVLDPAAIDLGVVRPGQVVQGRFTVADVLADGYTPTLRTLELSGDGAQWASVDSVFPLPADLDFPIPVSVTVSGLPLSAPVGEVALTLRATGDAPGDDFELLGTVTLWIGSCDRDGDGFFDVACGGDDCDDERAQTYPGAPELCNGLDDDCNRFVDDAPDVDGDGFTACEDCDDTDPEIYPRAPERCNGLDDDCDGFLGPDEEDEDGDGYAICDGDCDDLDRAINPGAPEPCDGLDNNCNGVIDDPFDGDRDGVDACDDCDDRDPGRYPGAEERCNGVDDDCDGDLADFEADLDGDGIAECEGDCDDDDGAVFPGAPEVCNGASDDCDADIDEDGACPCTRVTFDGDVYQFCSAGRSWTSAQSTCDGWNYHLLTVDSESEDTFAFRTVTRIDATQRWWMGFNDRAREGTWVWEDGSEVTYTNWNIAEPNDTGSGEDCGQLNRYGDGTWNDEPCSRTLPYVCELD